MIRILPLLILGLLLCGEVDAQKAVKVDKKSRKEPDTLAYYMKDEYNMAYDQNDAEFLRLIIKVDSGFFNFQDYYMNGNQKMDARSYRSDMLFNVLLDGVYKDFYKNGNKKTISNYKKGIMYGDFATYYPNGNLYSIITFSKEDFYLKESRDSTGKVLAENGNGHWIKFNDDFKDKFEEGSVVNGKEDGNWNAWDIQNKKYEFKYINGNDIRPLEYRISENKIFSKVQIPPYFIGGDDAFGRYLAKAIKYPARARKNNVQGKVMLSFVVERDGSVSDVKVMSSLGSGTDEEAIRVLKTTAWRPGILYGKTVRVKYTVPIQFKLTN